jgi:uncharacterized membrane protein YcjF (UPF0283 family)
VRSQLARFALFASLLLLLCSVLFIVNQIAQVVALANTIGPVFGRIVLVALLAAFGVVISVPLVMIVRLPTALHPPVSAQASEHQTYMRRLGARLETNPHLAGKDFHFSDRTGIEVALRILDAHANGIIKRTASTVFVSTAISQNGRLDALMVLAAQTQMIWQVARVYNQRPSLREMIRLYSNVGVTVFAASQLEDLDLSEQVEPVIRTAISGSLASLVPGITHISSIVTNSILEGTANAYLTLRVGVVCRTYCGSLAAFDRTVARRFASVTAAAMLGSIVKESAARVAKAILSAAKNAGVSTAAGIRGAGERLNPFKKQRE